MRRLLYIFFLILKYLVPATSQYTIEWYQRDTNEVSATEIGILNDQVYAINSFPGDNIGLHYISKILPNGELEFVKQYNFIDTFKVVGINNIFQSHESYFICITLSDEANNLHFEIFEMDKEFNIMESVLSHPCNYTFSTDLLDVDYIEPFKDLTFQLYETQNVLENPKRVFEISMIDKIPTVKVFTPPIGKKIQRRRNRMLIKNANSGNYVIPLRSVDLNSPYDSLTILDNIFEPKFQFRPTVQYGGSLNSGFEFILGYSNDTIYQGRWGLGINTPRSQFNYVNTVVGDKDSTYVAGREPLLDSLYGLTKYKKNESDNSYLLIDHFGGFLGEGAIIAKIMNHKDIDFRIKRDIPDLFPYEVEENNGCYYGLALGVNPYRELVYVIKPIVSTQEQDFKVDLPLSIFPNPFETFLELEIPEKLAEPFDITITNIEGKSVYYQHSYYKKNKLDLSFLSKGIYIVSVKDENNKLVKGKLLKH